MNIFCATGNLGNDAEVRQTVTTTLATFSLAVKTGYGDKQATMWVRANLWGKRAEGGLIQYLKKGQQVAVSGELKLNTYTTNEGVERTNLELNVNELDLIGSKGANALNKEAAPAAPIDEEIPF